MLEQFLSKILQFRLRIKLKTDTSIFLLNITIKFKYVLVKNYMFIEVLQKYTIFKIHPK